MRKLLRRLGARTLTALDLARPGAAGRSGGPAPAGPSVRRRLRRAERQQRRLDRERRRLDRERRRLIAAELAEYRTPRERTELQQILARHSADEVSEIADLLPPRRH